MEKWRLEVGGWRLVGFGAPPEPWGGGEVVTFGEAEGPSLLCRHQWLDRLVLCRRLVG